MPTRTTTMRKTAKFMLISALLLAIASTIVGYSESVVQNAVSGAIVGALSGLLTCAAVCGLGNRLMPQVDARHPGTSAITGAIIGGYVGLIVTSVLVTLAVTIVGSINHLPAPFLCGALLSSLGGWAIGGLLGVLIGVSWS